MHAYECIANVFNEQNEQNLTKYIRMNFSAKSKMGHVYM